MHFKANKYIAEKIQNYLINPLNYTDDKINRKIKRKKKQLSKRNKRIMRRRRTLNKLKREKKFYFPFPILSKHLPTSGLPSAFRSSFFRTFYSLQSAILNTVPKSNLRSWYLYVFMPLKKMSFSSIFFFFSFFFFSFQNPSLSLRSQASLSTDY